VAGLIAGAPPAAFRKWLKWLSAIEGKRPSEPHYYLEFLGVDPLLQGKGLGSAMLDRLTEWADQEHAGCYLETGNPRDVPLFRRYGFEPSVEEGVLGVHTWFMWRPPRQPATTPGSS
jgi:GNAT superfamily N-acetyltransferase